jgi:transketolase
MGNFSPRNLRKTVLKMAYSGSTVHVPCAFSIVEICSVIYSRFLNTGNATNDPTRDYFVLSKGHGVMSVYACLKELGWLSESDIENYFKDGTKLKGLSDCHVKGLEVTSGSLGHGLSVAVGIALGLKFRKTNQKVYCLVGDGESNEGAVWEALLFAAHWKLNNLIVIFDCNGFQAMGETKEIMNLGSMSEKLRAFNFETEEIDGHNEKQITITLDKFLGSKTEQPKAIVANTVKGKGISFMEGQNYWHYTRLNTDTYTAALKELGDLS